MFGKMKMCEVNCYLINPVNTTEILTHAHIEMETNDTSTATHSNNITGQLCYLTLSEETKK